MYKVTYVTSRLFNALFDWPPVLTLEQRLSWDISQCLSHPVVLRENNVGLAIS